MLVTSLVCQPKASIFGKWTCNKWLLQSPREGQDPINPFHLIGPSGSSDSPLPPSCLLLTRQTERIPNGLFVQENGQTRQRNYVENGKRSYKIKIDPVRSCVLLWPRQKSEWRRGQVSRFERRRVAWGRHSAHWFWPFRICTWAIWVTA